MDTLNLVFGGTLDLTLNLVERYNTMQSRRG